MIVKEDFLKILDRVSDTEEIIFTHNNIVYDKIETAIANTKNGKIIIELAGGNTNTVGRKDSYRKGLYGRDNTR